jgi:Protein of unknown function (DUF992)
MSTFRQTVVGGTVLFALNLFAAEHAAAQNAKVGMLSCRTSASMGLLVGSRQGIRCRFTPDGGGRPENYTGRIGRLGLDIGVTAGGVLAWAVFMRTKRPARGALRHLCGRKRRYRDWRGRRCQLAGRRFEQHRRAPTALGRRPGRAQSCSRNCGLDVGSRALASCSAASEFSPLCGAWPASQKRRNLNAAAA